MSPLFVSEYVSSLSRRRQPRSGSASSKSTSRYPSTPHRSARDKSISRHPPRERIGEHGVPSPSTELDRIFWRAMHRETPFPPCPPRSVQTRRCTTASLGQIFPVPAGLRDGVEPVAAYQEPRGKTITVNRCARLEAWMLVIRMSRRIALRSRPCLQPCRGRHTPRVLASIGSNASTPS